MKKPEGYDQTEAFTGEFKTLQPGGYICKILSAKTETTQSGKEQFVIMFDIAEGEYKDYYKEQHAKKYESNPEAKWQGIYRQLTEGNSTRFYKGMLTAIEKSNPGFIVNWDKDEKQFAGKLFGGVFGQEEFVANDQSIKLNTRLRFIRSVEQVKNGVEIPPIKKLEGNVGAFGGQVMPEEKMPWD